MFKKISIATLLTSIVITGFAMNSQQKLSYAMGYETGKALKSHKISLDPSTYASGMDAALSGKAGQMTQKQMQAILINFQKHQFEAFQARQKAKATKDASTGETFLNTNAKKAGIIRLKSGLQYKVLKKGTGAKPSASDTVTVNYTGKLINGHVFDSSAKHGGPATFPVDGVIKGWTQALQMMHVGGTWELFIPAKLAYGKRGMPGAIPPNATLIFTVHLLAIK